MCRHHFPLFKWAEIFKNERRRCCEWDSMIPSYSLFSLWNHINLVSTQITMWLHNRNDIKWKDRECAQIGNGRIWFWSFEISGSLCFNYTFRDIRTLWFRVNLELNERAQVCEHLKSESFAWYDDDDVDKCVDWLMMRKQLWPTMPHRPHFGGVIFFIFLNTTPPTIHIFSSKNKQQQEKNIKNEEKKNDNQTKH